MGDPYAGDISDAFKFSFLRALAGDDRRLGSTFSYGTGINDPGQVVGFIRVGYQEGTP
jgi:hypothetical protein